MSGCNGKRGLHWLVVLLLAAPVVFADSAKQDIEAICPRALALEARVISSAPRCVASTVGLTSTVKHGDTEGIASGSGVVISAEGLILTAGHVIEKPGTSLTIRFADGRVVQGVAVGLDHAMDSGLAKITDPAPSGGWPFSPLAPADSAQPGDWVLAAGHPGAIVLDRQPPLRLGRVTAHGADKIDTNCALEPGDSGGPLFDLNGRVVGINSRIATVPGSVMKEFMSTHVPASIFHAQMKELLAGADAHRGTQVGESFNKGRKPTTAGGKTALLQKAIRKLAAAGDPEAGKLMAEAKANGGKLSMTPEMMDHLIHKAGLDDTASTRPVDEASGPASRPATQPTGSATQPAAQGIAANLRPAISDQMKKALLAQYPNATISDALLNRIMDQSTLIDGHLTIETTEADLREMGIAAAGQPRRVVDSAHANRLALGAGKTSLQTLALIAPLLDETGDSVVEIRDGQQLALLGTIVDADGYIVTKSSDLPKHPTVVLADGRRLAARLIGADTATDLALLKVDARGLKPVTFTTEARLGAWVTALTEDPSEPALGIISHAARPIPEVFSHFSGEKQLVLGVGFSGVEPVVSILTPEMPAEIAGMKVGDRIVELNGQAIDTSAKFVTLMKSHKSGETLKLKVQRGEKAIELTPLLGKSKPATQVSKGIGETDGLTAGKTSKRRTNFPMAVQTDAAIWANQVGGPLIDLHGKAVGITIARYDLVCTFALPADLVMKTVDKLKAQAQP